MSENVNQIPVEPPDDINKPFFAYGVFKEGQIAHSKIKHYVDHIDYDVEVLNCKMMIRDGIPLIAPIYSDDYDIKGQIIYFNQGDEVDAYNAISATEPKDLYEWGNITVEGIEANVLYGVNPDQGAYLYETDNGEYIDTFDGSQDPFFSEMLDFLEKERDNLKYDDYYIFRCQMIYMSLWSAIDRYCTLKYDSVNYQADNIRTLSADPVFIESINESNLPYRNPIYSTKDATDWKWQNSPYSKLYYYYVLRNNIIHRGKDRKTNIGVLGLCLKELLGIFRKVVNKTFKKEH